MANNPLGPQPDFASIARSHRILADEMEKVPNTPQFDAGDAILRELRAMEQRMNAKMDTMEQRINTRFDQVNTRFDQVNTRFDQVDARLDQVDIQIQAR
jgi:outer membrane protein TolC